MRRTSLAVMLVAVAFLAAPAAHAQGFKQTNLVSDVPGEARHTDANLVNPWGVVPGPTGIFWTANNESGNSTLYDPDGNPRPLVVAIPGGKPTGVVVTVSSDASFRIPSADSSARAIFIFVTQNGTVAAWSPTVNTTNAIQVAETKGAGYTGAALGGVPSAPRLYAANFAAGKIDVYNRDFGLITLAGNFLDPTLPSGYLPFNIANIGGQLFVAYAQQDPATGDEVKGIGLGYVSVFDLQGHFLRRFASSDHLNAPWAIVRAPAGFGTFGGDVLIGNFGNGWINAYDLATGSFEGTMRDTLGNPIVVDGLWGLHFGLPVSGAEVAHRLYFAAGIDDEAHGLFGYLATRRAAGEPVCDNNSKGAAFWRKQCGGPRHDTDRDDNDRGNGSGRGKSGGEGKDKGRGFGHDKGPRSGVPSDSLTALFQCIGSAVAPNAFGTAGCFTAGCDLLQQVGRGTDRERSVRERAARALLVARLDLCAGLVCDNLLIGCTEAKDGVRVLSVGDVADSLDEILCNGGSTATLRSLTRLLACATNTDEDKDDDRDEDRGDRGGRDDSPSALSPNVAISVSGGQPVRLSSGPVRFTVNTTTPSMVQLRIYDALGRLVAEPLRNSMVSGGVQVQWDGRDVRGGFVSPGNYFYRATAGAGASSGRIVIVR